MFGEPVRKEPPHGHPDFWRAFKTLPIQEFFEDWKDKYKNLEWVVIPYEDDGNIAGRHLKEDEVCTNIQFLV